MYRSIIILIIIFGSLSAQPDKKSSWLNETDDISLEKGENSPDNKNDLKEDQKVTIIKKKNAEENLPFGLTGERSSNVQERKNRLNY